MTDYTRGYPHLADNHRGGDWDYAFLKQLCEVSGVNHKTIQKHVRALTAMLDQRGVQV